MPNDFKFTGTSDAFTVRCLRKDDFYVGIGDHEKGPNSSTTSRYFNGHSGATGSTDFAYNVHIGKGTSGPSIYAVNGAAGLTAVIGFAGNTSGATSLALALQHANLTGAMIVTNYAYPSLVTDGLTVHCDAKWIPSSSQFHPYSDNTTALPVNSLYMRSVALGLTSSAAATGAFLYTTNGGLDQLLYNRTGGFFDFTGGNNIRFEAQPASIPNMATLLGVNTWTGTTVVCWFKGPTVQPPGTLEGLLSQGAARSTTGSQYVLGPISNPITRRDEMRFWWRGDWTQGATLQFSFTGGSVPYDRWHMWVGRATAGGSNLWTDRGLTSSWVVTTNTGTVSESSSLPLWLGRSTESVNSASAKGNLQAWSIYNRRLSDAELLYNYYRGGIITNGLTAMWDTSNIVSYPGTGTNIYDMQWNVEAVAGGTVVNSPVFTPRYGGMFDLNVDASDQYVNLGGNAALNYTSQDFSVDGWFIADLDTSDMPIFGKGLLNITGSGRGFALYTASSNSLIFTTVQASSAQTTISSNASWVSGRWTYFCVTRSGANVKIYTNASAAGGVGGTGGGKLADRTSAAATHSNPASSSGDPLTWGFFDLGGISGESYLDGKVSELRVYNRTLSFAEVLTNFQATKSQFISF
jgi:hypothetical protein